MKNCPPKSPHPFGGHWKDLIDFPSCIAYGRGCWVEREREIQSSALSPESMVAAVRSTFPSCRTYGCGCLLKRFNLLPFAYGWGCMLKRFNLLPFLQSLWSRLSAGEIQSTSLPAWSRSCVEEIQSASLPAEPMVEIVQLRDSNCFPSCKKARR